MICQTTYINQLPEEFQDNIRVRLDKVLGASLSSVEKEKAIRDAMDGRLCDLDELIPMVELLRLMKG